MSSKRTGRFPTHAAPSSGEESRTTSFRCEAIGTRQTLKLSFVFTFLWMVIAHASRWFNTTSASHDGLALTATPTEMAHQIALGRFLWPIYTIVRGSVAAPYLVGILSSLFIALSVYLIARILKTEGPVAICAIAGALSTSITVTTLNASYTGWFDADMLSLLLSVLAVYMVVQWRSIAAGSIALAASMGLYQSYLQMFIALALITVIVFTLDGAPPRQHLRLAATLLVALILGILVYAIAMRAAMFIASVAPTTGYNGLASVGDYSNESVIALIIKAYILPFAYLIYPETHLPTIAGICNIALGISTLCGAVLLSRRKRLSTLSIVIVALCILALPFGCSLIYVISHGVMHGLMIHSFSSLYLLAIAIAVRVSHSSRQPTSTFRPSRRQAVLSGTCVVLFAIFAFNAVYANELYVRKDMESYATLSTMTRVVDQLEHLDGYVPGETQVILIGTLAESPIAQDRPGFPPNQAHIPLESLVGQLHSTGFYSDYSVTYLQTYRFYFTYLLGYPIAISDDATTRAFEDKPEVKAMGTFPSSTSIGWVDDSVVVKFS